LTRPFDGRKLADMKTSWFRAFSFLLSLWLLPAAADTNAPPRLTVELRDGSRLVGTSVREQFKFHTELLGELKLDVKDIRMVECGATNLCKLTTAKGDTLTVSFDEATLGVRTSFGKVELPVAAIRKLTVAAGPGNRTHLPGLVSWWPAEGNANDMVSGNNGTLLNDASFDVGKVGQAFLFGTADDGVEVPASPTLDLGLGNGLTVEGWINPSTLATRGYIVEWNDGDTNQSVPFGVQLQILGPDEMGLGAGNLFADVRGNDGQPHWMMAPGGTIQANIFQHVALTYDKLSGVATLYCNGVVVAQSTMGSFTPLTSYDFYIGRRPAAGAGSFPGRIDEISVYNRALSAREIQDQCREDNGGELPPPPPESSLRPQQTPFFSGRYPGGIRPGGPMP
jgi:hypothetical protein